MPTVLINPPRQNKKKRYSNVLLSPCTSSFFVLCMDDLLDSNPWCSLAFPVADDNTFPAQGCSLLECKRAADLQH